MKHLFILLFLGGLFSSCKKSNLSEQGSIDRDPKFARKLISIKHQSGYTIAMSYNADGSLTSITDNFNTQTSFSYMPDFALTYKYPGTVFEMKHTTKNQMGRITKAELWKNDVLIDKDEYTYNAEGYLVKKRTVKVATGAISITDYTYENGNLVSLKSYQDGTLRYSHQFTYYTDKVNKFNVDVYDQFELKFMAGTFFGRHNRHLLKSWSFINHSSNSSHSNEYTYTLDADGYPVKLTHIDDGYTTSANFIFQ